MSEQEKMISLEDELSSFGRYFEVNDRCILSAPFGEGKSFFLNEFIKEKCKDYDFITLYPTNYQVCDNKDIFEYIKRDVLLALLALDPEILEGYDKTRAQIVWDSIVDCQGDVISCLPDISIGISGMVGATISPAKILGVIRAIKKKCRRNWFNVRNPIRSYLDSFETASGIYEFNPVSNLIASLIADRKQKSRKVVLVIEDLDRIDPAHIFKILNVFSAHFADNLDNTFSKNKFGFDKVLLLCDFDNIKKIYQHKYGADTDFKGYISKFSAVPPFEYCIRSKIAKHISGLLEKYVKEPVVSAVLADEIVASTKPSSTELKENIRNIIDRIEFASKQYKVEKIEVKVKKDLFLYDEYLDEAKDAFGALFITTDKPLFAFLSICKAFSVDSKNLLKKIAEAPRQFNEPKHVVELCGVLSIIIMSELPPILSGDFKYKFGGQRGDELVISESGEILGLIKNPYNGSGLESFIVETFLEKLDDFKQYLY